MLKALVVKPISAVHVGTLIFLHGLGDSGHGWQGEMRRLQAQLPGLKVILPHASVRPITLNGGHHMPGWYDIRSLSSSMNIDEDEIGLKESRNLLHLLIKKEMEDSGLGLDRIFIGGFSQGAAVCLYSILTSSQSEDIDISRLGGVIALSGYVPCHRSLQKLQRIPDLPSLFIGHGIEDNVVSLKWHEESVAFIQNSYKNRKLPLEARQYVGLGHSFSESVFRDMCRFLCDHF